MALAIDASSPAVATGAPTATTASFTPPAGSVLTILASMDSNASNPPAPSITDSLGVHLTYTLVGWKSFADAPAVGGQAAIWQAVVGTSAPMTVSVTNGVAAFNAGVKVLVWTGADTTNPVGANGKSGTSTSQTTVSQSYTAQATGGQGVIAICDWDVTGAETAGTGNTIVASANIATSITYTFDRRTSADDVNGNSNTLATTLASASFDLSWVYAEVQPAPAATGPVAGPYLGHPPGRISPTGVWSPFPYSSDPGVTLVALSDSGSAADQLAVTATVPLSDTGSASDALTVTATVPLTDSGTAADTLAAAATVPLADTGTASDAFAVSATVPVSDTGAASDALTVAAAVPVSDAGSAADGLAVTVTVPLGESGTAADALAIAASVSLADTGTAADVLGITATLGFGDAGSGSDGLSVVAAQAFADVGTALDALGVTAVVPMVDAGSGVDVLVANTGAAVKTLTDSGTASDALCVCKVQLRPGSGTTARPGTGTTVRATATTTRPATGTTTRPNTGTTGDCC